MREGGDCSLREQRLRVCAAGEHTDGEQERRAEDGEQRSETSEDDAPLCLEDEGRHDAANRYRGPASACASASRHTYAPPGR